VVASPSPIFHDLAAGFARGKHRPVSARALAVAALSGEANADEVRMHDRVVTFASNHAGRILGGVSTGQPIVARFAVKPTSSILTPR
jgi:chorismate synthase